MLTSQLDTIRGVVAFVARRSRLSPDDADELSSYVLLKLVEDDYAVLRRFEHRSTLRTYLTVVVQRLVLDQRNARWGKWRPSAGARRLGRAGVQLEMLVVRHGLSVEESRQVMQAEYGLQLDPEDLEEFQRRLRLKPRRELLGEEALRDVPAREPGPAYALEAEDTASASRRAASVLSAAIADLGDADRTLLTLRYREGLSIAAIARKLAVDQKPLYRRQERLLSHLRARLQAAGLTRADVLTLVGQPNVEVPSVVPPAASSDPDLTTRCA